MGGMGLMIISGIASLVGMFVSNRLKSKFDMYSQQGLRNGLSGREIAEAMLRHYGIFDVKVQLAQGYLTDHYNPADKTVNLSEPVFNARSVSAAAVAAHECGHAVQHARAYAPLTFRSAIVPVVNISSNVQKYILLGSAIGMGLGNKIGGILLVVTLVVFGITALFSLITLPVEFDASNRALAWLEETNTTMPQELAGAKDALWWAAMTYVSAALAALASFLYLLMRFRQQNASENRN
jgi:uncharacterized protein